MTPPSGGDVRQQVLFRLEPCGGLLHAVPHPTPTPHCTGWCPDGRKPAQAPNHLFVNFIEQHVNVDELDALLGCLYRYLKQLHKLYLTDIELKITTSDSQRIRIFVHNPSGYVPHTEVSALPCLRWYVCWCVHRQ